MAGADDMLRSTLGANGYAVLLAVAGHAEPVSGRAIASELKVSPTTASTRLGRLEAADFVRSTRSGRSLLWRLNTDSDVVRAWLRESRGAEGAGVEDAGASPVSTGGGGVTFERKVAVGYLSRLLLGHGAAELGSGRVVVSVAFQRAPEYTVDDLLVGAAGEGEDKPSLILAVAARRTPNVVDSDEKSQGLFRAFVKQLLDTPSHGPELRLGLAVAGPQNHAQQLAALAALASAQPDAAGFFRLVRTPTKFDEKVRARLEQVEKLVRRALIGLGVVEPSTGVVQQQTWALLSRLRVLMPRVESGDDPDWSTLANMLIPVSRREDLYGGTLLRDRLLALADDWAPAAASVDLSMLRREVHDLLDPTKRSGRPGWGALEQHRAVAFTTVRRTLGADTDALTDGAAPFALPFIDRRAELAAEFRRVASEGGALVVTGSSGTGKSALVLSVIETLETSQGAAFEALVVNFRELPNTSAEFQHMLGAPIGRLMAELSAPSRVLVIDAADAAIERSARLLQSLVTAASNAGLGIVAVAADPAADFVREQLDIGRRQPSQTFTMKPLDDTELAQVAQRFPLLQGLLHDLPETSLLRRMVVLDLLSRTGVELDGPMGEWECLELIWKNVVRGDGRPIQGSPQAREDVLLTLAAASLEGPGSSASPGSLDPAAVDALRADHLLAPYNTFRPRPQFAHDEVRRYATAIHLVRSGRVVETLQEAEVPRWALSAVTLACEGHLVDSAQQVKMVFQNLLSGFHEIARTHGSRWADVPVEAVLETPAAYECIKAALDAETAALRLSDVLRVLQQRCSFEGFVHPALGTPVARYLIEQQEPWNISEQAFEVLTNWLQALVLTDEPAGHELRAALRARLVSFWAAYPRKEATEEALPDWMPRRRRRRRALDYKVTDDEFVETLALLGRDMDSDIETCLRALAEDAPAFLAPAVDAPFSARSIAQHDPELLADLLEGYYIDEDADSGWNHLDEGVRGHQGRWMGFGPPFAAYYFGGFWQLFNSAPLATSVRVLNNLLNHAARTRVETTSRLDRSLQEREDLPDGAVSEVESPDSSGVTLNLTGEPRFYVGDSHVWTWYRATSVGPSPCMSALAAMERVAEGLMTSGASPRLIAEYLLTGCENLATPGLLYGLFVRNIEKSGPQLDRFLAEPAVWFLEFGRATSEHYGFRASSEGLAHPERRQWTPREVSVWLMTHATEERRNELRTIGEQLVANADRQGLEREQSLNWAANLDESRYRLTQEGDDVYLQVIPPPEVVAAQSKVAAQQEQVHTVLRLQNRYWGSAKHEAGYEPPTPEEIASDLAAARALLEASEPMQMRPHDAAAHVARTAIERASHGQPEALGEEVAFAVQLVVAVAATFLDSEDLRDEGQYFDLGADRAAARALPALLTPSMASALSEAHVTTADVGSVGIALAGKAPLETRLFLARGLDVLWASPCTGADCVHKTALAWINESARGAEIGPWDAEEQRSPRIRTEGDVTGRLKQIDGDSVDIAVLDPAIRALGVAATTDHCVSSEAMQILSDLLAVQRNAMVRHEEKGWDADHRGTHTLVAARALLQSYAANGDPAPILEQLDALRTDAGLLVNILHGLAAAGAENDTLADAARGVWANVLTHALTYAETDPIPYREGTWGSWAAAALLPDPLPWTQGLYNELSGPPIDWVEPTRLIDLIDAWLPVGRGEARCLDALIRLVRKLPLEEQASRGLAWVAQACTRGDQVVVQQSWSSNDWLKEVRAAVEEQGTLPEWQALVDALVVAGNSSLAPFST